ncbi:D-xylose transporter XylE [Flavobacteriaceae bacterium F89]|uniref:D-xylose transporter XylE n=1 Tax=Cerina litoralis TaxID=2874477 RepID=A0AAE3EZA0_9FLAO|nr:D-xylose transporter XylE [Cerina litoralis]MCG2462366.1 D-xylose transporter XylE [Cerina litoralis]
MNKEKQKIPRIIYIITASAVIGGFLFGYDTAVVSGTIGALEKNFILPQGFDVTAANWWLGFTVSSALIGCIIGALSGGYVSDKFGRKKAMVLSAILFFVSALGSAFPETGITSLGEQPSSVWAVFVGYRIIGGIGVGLASMLAPMYISEVAPAHIRGRLVSWNQFAIVIGVFISFLVNYQIGKMGDTEWLNTTGWRYMFGAEALPALVYFFMLFRVPESPRWLVLKGKELDSEMIFKRLSPTEDIKLLISNIKKPVTKVGTKRVIDSFQILKIGVFLAIFQQFIGINVVLYYAPEIFKSVGAKGDEALWQSVIVGLANMVFTIIAIEKVDLFGRKPLMLIGALGMTISMGLMGFAFFAGFNGIYILVFMLLYISFFAMSWGPVTWVLIAEIFPNEIRARAMSIAVASMWVSNFLVSQTFPVLDKNPYLAEKFNHGFAYWVYAAVSLVAFLFILKKVPETRGKTLEEMEEFWNKSRT